MKQPTIIEFYIKFNTAIEFYVKFNTVLEFYVKFNIFKFLINFKYLSSWNIIFLSLWYN